MDYRFQVKATPFDFFMMSMKKTYRSPLGICNLVFFIAVLLMTFKFFGNASDGIRCILIFLCLLIPVIQPFCVYMRAKTLAGMMPEDMTIETDKTGLLVRVGDRAEIVSYSRIKKVIDTGDCLVLNVGGRNGYFLFNRVMGDQKDGFIKFLRSQTV